MTAVDNRAASIREASRFMGVLSGMCAIRSGFCVRSRRDCDEENANRRSVYAARKRDSHTGGNRSNLPIAEKEEDSTKTYIEKQARCTLLFNYIQYITL